MNGTLSALRFTAPVASINDAAVNSPAGTSGTANGPVQANKLQHQYQPVYAQPSASNVAAESKVVHVVKGANATIVAVDAGHVTQPGASTTTTIDVKKNGATILTATISLDNTTANFATKTGTLSVTTAVAGDVLEVICTTSGANPGKGIFCRVTVREDPQ